MAYVRKTFSHLRSVLEVPLGDDNYWPKIPSVDADGIMLDLEDSVPPTRKNAARDSAVSICTRRDITQAKTVFVRVNNLATEWGEADLRTLGACPADLVICYPKVESAEEIRSAVRIAQVAGRERTFHVMIESYRGVEAVDEILANENVVGVHFGYVDYGFAVGCRIFSPEGDDLHGPAMTVPRARIAAAAAARGIFSTGGSLIPDFRDMEKVARFVRSWRRLHSLHRLVAPACDSHSRKHQDASG
jgi:citrate lyase subunit beta / citryl-CoA lyase